MFSTLVGSRLPPRYQRFFKLPDSTLVGSRLPPRYQRFFKLPERVASWKPTDTRNTVLGQAALRWFEGQQASAGLFRLDSGQDALVACACAC
jgi:hypothetical protein